jgi:signal peptidase I
MESLTGIRNRLQAFNRWTKGWAGSIAIAVLIWIVLRSYLIEAFRIPSASMENTLLVGDFLFVNKAIYSGELEIPFTGIRFWRLPGYAEPERGGIVVFRSVEDSTPNLDIVKRAVGAAGDTLRMVRDTVFRNGTRLDEPYALHFDPRNVDDVQLSKIRAWQLRYYAGRDTVHYHPTTHDWGPIVVPSGHYFVMGDNRDESYDSRYWGFLPRSHIVGKPLFIYFSIATEPLRIRWNRLLRRPR